MALPKIPMPRSTVDLDGTPVQVRGLTRSEAARLQNLVQAGTEPSELEIVLLAIGTDTPEDEARAWYEECPAGAVDPILVEIQKLSGLGDARFQNGKSDSSGGD